MTSHEAMVRLEHLRDEAQGLQREPLLESDLRAWYDSMLEALSQIYGQESTTRREFEQIYFGFPPETFQKAAEWLRADLQRRGMDIPDPFHIPLADYYRQALIESAEFLSSLVIKLKMNNV
jgi:hypothetical protein